MRKKFLITIIFILLIIAMTFPLIFETTTHIPGFFSTDEPYGAIWSFWRIKYSFLNKLSLKRTDLIAHPFGMDLYASGSISYLWLFWTHLLSIFTTPVLTWNIQILLNLFLSLVFSYLLVFYLTKNKLSGILGGTIFGLCPYQFVRIWQHVGLTYNQWLLLILLSVILLKENPFSKKRIFLFFISFFLLLSFDWSIMYMGIISLFCFLVYVFFYRWRVKFFKKNELFISDFRFLGKVFISMALVFVILLPQFLWAIKNRLSMNKINFTPSAFSHYARPFEDLFTQSAKPLSYLLPAVVHPIFGKFTERFIGSHLYGVSFTEHTLYLGWTGLTLAFIAFRAWRKRRKNKQLTINSEQLTEREDFYIGFFVFLSIVAWFFSQPPWWKFGPIKIFMPSFFMYKILPMFRAYCRFGIVLMLPVSVLAGFGLKFILERFKHRKTKLAITALFCSLVLFEFWNYPPYKVIDVSKVPEVYYWLKEQPGDFAIAEYPLDADSPNEMYKFYQTKHEKKIINGTIPGSYANRVAQEIRNLSEPRTAGILKWRGVRYVIVHYDGYLNSELLEDKKEFEKIPQNSSLKLVKSFPAEECPKKDIMCVKKTGPIDVYEVIAEPINPNLCMLE
ncbi:MAG: hypothetical protein NC818_01410 [Candidatus Omnitrophica bacterium]|nr:hypothetical protein [Candidatus Omnitrophota bacterium]